MSESVTEFNKLLNEVGDNFFRDKSIYTSDGVWNELERFDGLEINLEELKKYFRMIININHYDKQTQKFTHYISEFRHCKESDFKDKDIKFVEKYKIRFCPKLEDLADIWYISSPSSFEKNFQTYSIEIVKCKDAKHGGAEGDVCYDDPKVAEVLKHLVIQFHETRTIFDQEHAADYDIPLKSYDQVSSTFQVHTNEFVGIQSFMSIQILHRASSRFFSWGTPEEINYLEKVHVRPPFYNN